MTDHTVVRYPCPAWLRDRFPASGRLFFDQFVDLALYHPESGYYGRGVERIGPRGDYVTGSTLHPAFARAMARLARTIFRRIDESASNPATLDFVDVGAGTGRFLAAFAKALAEIVPEYSTRTRLFAVEKSDRLRGEISGLASPLLLTPLAKESDLPGALNGIVFSYELFDALPFARVMGLEDGSFVEEVVVIDGGSIHIGVDEPRPEIRQLVETIGVVLEPGQEAEVTPAAAPLYKSLTSQLTSGLVVTFDYGAKTRALYSAAGRFHGTAMAYSQHRAHRGLLENPGEQDLTAHVDFGRLQSAGEEAGAKTLGFFSQMRFLLTAGGFDGELASEPIVGESRADFLRLIEPEGMGEELRVLVQEKGRFPNELANLFEYNHLEKKPRPATGLGAA